MNNSRKSVTWSAVLCPLISFLDMSYSISFVAAVESPHRDIFSEPAGRSSEPAGRASKRARGASEEATMLGGPQIKLGEP